MSEPREPSPAPDGGFTCQGCGAPFRTRRELDLHNAETHGGGSTGGNTDEPGSIGASDETPLGG